MSRNTFNLTLSEINVIKASMMSLPSIHIETNPIKIKNSDEYVLILHSDDASQMLKIQSIIHNLIKSRKIIENSPIRRSVIVRFIKWFNIKVLRN